MYMTGCLLESRGKNFLIFQVFLIKILDKENILKIFLRNFLKYIFYHIRLLTLFTQTKKKHKATQVSRIKRSGKKN